MTISGLHYITNGASEIEILEEVKAVVNAGCEWVQLRIKNEALDFISIATKVKLICKDRATFIINDHPAIAKQIDADGVHLGLEDLPIQEARVMLGEGKIIGGTANTKQDCLNRQADGADYIGLGPFRMTVTKKKLSPILGLDGFESIIPKNQTEIKIPVLAIGGIELEDLDVLKKQTGIHGIAVSGLIANSADKKSLIKAITNRLIEDNNVVVSNH